MYGVSSRADVTSNPDDALACDWSREKHKADSLKALGAAIARYFANKVSRFFRKNLKDFRG